MWRQILVISLLVTLCELWNGVEARTENEPFVFRNVDSRIRRLDEDADLEETKIDAAGAGLNLDVQPPGTSSQEGDAKPKTQTSQNETSKNDNKIHGSAPLEGGKHREGVSIGGKVVSGSDVMFIVTVAACSVAGLIGIIMAGVCWYKLSRSAKAASDVEYPAYGVTGPTKDRVPSPGDRKLAQSAQMYHYQHQKQQMIAMEKANGEMKHDASDEESEEENEEGDYTVYECPGLAPTGEMEVKNPLFTDETPVTPSAGDEKKD